MAEITKSFATIEKELAELKAAAIEVYEAGYWVLETFNDDEQETLWKGLRDALGRGPSPDAVKKDLAEAREMICLLMKQREWGAATGALFEDPVVKKAMFAERAKRENG